MSRHEDLIRLRHMLDHAQEAVNLTRGKVREDLDANRLLELSLVRLMEIIGEGANRVSPGFKSQYLRIPPGRKLSACATASFTAMIR